MPNTNAFEQALKLLPERVRGPLLFLPTQQQEKTEEIRLRCGEKLSLTMLGDIRQTELCIHPEDIRETLERASQYSYHTVQESMKQGYLTAQGGLRIGICGSVRMENGVLSGFRTVSSLCIRIPHPADCVSEELLRRLAGRSVLIYSPPGAGKTTFLRELVRFASESGCRTAVADERGEIAALRDGVPQFDVGSNTDVMEFCPKTPAAERLIRAMNPQLLAMDELTNAEAELLERLAASGIQVIATAHADSRDALRRKGIETDCFDCFVHIVLRDGLREYIMEEGREC